VRHLSDPQSLGKMLYFCQNCDGRLKDPQVLKRLLAKGLNKFVAHEVAIDAVKASYSAQFEHVLQDPKETDELRVLDDDGERIFRNVSLNDLGPSICYEPE